mgnify:CR=1 FL=1
MYLKRLDLQGFKSFPEKVKLEFNPGVTAVVGPNGSGKSNVSDAVRWVLGEQRARSLRGDKMEDIIFAGTENRKPLGFAEVSILIDNQDGRLPLAYSEVQVTRRVFRSGESEYRINGTACRLKDIQELFMDTGVGREGYSIIGQGQIEQILSGKPEERRELFDEAAGIVKYKKNKLETQKSLEIERENLVRVTDILTELELVVTGKNNANRRAEFSLFPPEESVLISTDGHIISNMDQLGMATLGYIGPGGAENESTGEVPDDVITEIGSQNVNCNDSTDEVTEGIEEQGMQAAVCIVH